MDIVLLDKYRERLASISESGTYPQLCKSMSDLQILQSEIRQNCCPNTSFDDIDMEDFDSLKDYREYISDFVRRQFWGIEPEVISLLLDLENKLFLVGIRVEDLKADRFTT